MKKLGIVILLALLLASIGCVQGTSKKSTEEAAIPSGLYSAQILALTYTIVFDENKMTLQDNTGWSKVYTYQISEDGSVLTYTDVSTGQIQSETKPQYACSIGSITFNGTTYYKES